MFDLPSGEVCVVVGDVVGSGLTAAVAMGRLRTALRAYALQIQDPAELLHAVDVHVHHFERDVMATALCAVLDPTTHRLRLSCAGHPPPVLAVPRGPGRLVDVRPDVPLGVEPDRPRRTAELPLPAGHGLLLYTDGLIERRGVALDAGFDALRAAVRPGTAEEVCSTVMQELLGGTEAADDVALLMVLRRCPGDVEPLELRVPARPAELPRLRIEVRRWSAAVGATPEESDDLAGAVAAACTAVIAQAHRGTLAVRLHTGAGGTVAAEVGAPGTGGATVTVRRTFAGLS
ncbi:hypothetical protein BJF78_10690 [Pseudonocardia sp. CNS-139]|nr:hypothetical protein BJF78_10690 [Pseudonocardia sp. CNS-139]